MPPIIRYFGLSLITLALVLVQFASVSRADEPSQLEKLATTVKPAVVRVAEFCEGEVEYKSKENEEEITKTIYAGYRFLGSGFIISPNGYIATNAVIRDKAECTAKLLNLAKAKAKDNADDAVEASFKVSGDFSTDFSSAEDDPGYFVQLVYLPGSQDGIPFNYESGSGAFERGKDDVSVIKIKLDQENAPSLKLGDSDGVGLDNVTVIGYLYSVDSSAKLSQGQNEAKQNLDPSVTEGKISNANRRLSNGSQVFELALSGAYYGGSPVLNEQGEVIGITASGESDRLVQVEGLDTDISEASSNSSLTLAIPAQKIQSKIPAGIVNRQGEIDQYYQSGLALFWKGDYKGAKEKFEVVKDLFPQHSEIDGLITESNKRSVETWSKPPVGFWGALTAVAAFIVGLVIFLLRRKPTSKTSARSPKAASSKSPMTGISQNNGTASPWIELEGQGEWRQLPLQKDIHHIGRDPAWSDIELPTNWEVFSRHHATLRKEGGSYRIFDGDGKVASRNGLFVNEFTRVDSSNGYLLMSGDTITIGKGAEQVRITYFSPTATQPIQETKVAF